MTQEETIADKKIKFLEYYRQLPILRLAAASVGRDEDTLIRWRKDDTEFAEKVEAARTAWALEKAKGVRNQEWLLERVMKDYFSQRTELTGKDGKDLPTPILGGTTAKKDNEQVQPS